MENLKESAKKEKEEKSLLHKQLNLLPEEAADSSVLEKEVLDLSVHCANTLLLN